MTNIKAYENLTARQQLNLFRNLYYNDGNATEKGIIANAINDILPEYNRQKAEIEALKMDNAQLNSDIINANQNLDHITGLWEGEKEKVENAKQKVVTACKMLKTVKAEAIKEFLQKIESEKWNYGEEEDPIWVVELIDLNRIARDMTGGQKDGKDRSD